MPVWNKGGHCLFWLQIDHTTIKSNLNRLYKLKCFINCSVLYQHSFDAGKTLQYDSIPVVCSIDTTSKLHSERHIYFSTKCVFQMFKLSPFLFSFFFGRTRSSSLFSPLNSSADRVDVQLQSYHKAYSHQQMFAQQQGIDSLKPCRTDKYSCIDSVNATDRCAPPCCSPRMCVRWAEGDSTGQQRRLRGG